MKKINKLLFSLALLSLPQLAFCSYYAIQDTKTVVKNFNINKETLINILAKDTQVNIISDSVKEVTVIAEIVTKQNADDKKRAFFEDFENNVTRKIEHSKNELSINTDLDFPTEKTTQFKLFGSITYYNSEGYDLKYTIRIPSGNTVKINISYNNLVVDGDLREAYININSGDLRVGNIEKLRLEAKYGDVTLQNIVNASMNLYEVDLEAKKIDKLKLNSKYSDIVIDKLNFSEINSYEDEISIVEARQMSGVAKYSKFSFDKHIKNLDFNAIYETNITAGFIQFARLRESKYSKLNISEINELFFDNSYEDKLTVQKLNTFTIDGKYFKGEINSLDNSFKANLYEGDIKISEANSTAKLIHIDGKYNSIHINLSKVPFALSANINYGFVNLPSALEIEKKLYIEDNSKIKMEVNTLDYQNGLNLIFNGYETKVKLF